jgi:hypothetical protein
MIVPFFIPCLRCGRPPRLPADVAVDVDEAVFISAPSVASIAVDLVQPLHVGPQMHPDGTVDRDRPRDMARPADLVQIAVDQVSLRSP